MSKTTDYRSEASDDAANFVEEFADQVVEKLIDDGEASDDFLNDYGNADSYHHETHVDKAYNLSEAAEILDQLDDYEETDSGLWEGLQPREAISAQAAYTYGAAVYSMACDIIEAINEDDEIESLLEHRGKDIDDSMADDADGEKNDSYDEEFAEHIKATFPDNPNVTQEQFDAKLVELVTARVKEVIAENR